MSTWGMFALRRYLRVCREINELIVDLCRRPTEEEEATQETGETPVHSRHLTHGHRNPGRVSAEKH